MPAQGLAPPCEPEAKFVLKFSLDETASNNLYLQREQNTIYYVKG